MDAIRLTELISDEELKGINAQSEQLGTRYEELFSFIYDLRQADFLISTPQFISIQKLLVALVRNGESAVNFERLKTYLAPLVCSSPEDQTAFYQLFDRWLETHQPPALLLDNPAEEIHDEPEKTFQTSDEKQAVRNWRRSPAFAAAGLLVVSLIIAALIFYFPQSQTFTGTVRDEESNSPLADAEIVFGEKTFRSDGNGRFSFEYKSASNSQPLTVSRDEYQTLNTFIEPNEKQGEYSLTRTTATVPPSTPLPTATPTDQAARTVEPPPAPQTFYQRYYFEILLAAALLPFVIYGLWLLRQWRRRRQLERWREKNQPDFKNLTLEKSENFLYRSPAFRRHAQELRRHRRVPTGALEINQTVEATVRSGGLFKPVSGTRQISPEYLVLVDRLGFRDQKGRLEDKILDRFKREGVFFECFYFNRDPRLCRPKTVNRKGEMPKFYNLQELSAQYPEHRLLIFSDGAGMIDDFASRPHRWVKSLSNWETRALLTPNSALTYHEWILEQEAGLPVMPAHESDLKTLVEIIRTGDVPKIKSYAENTNYPPTLLEDYEQWWLRRANPRRADSDENAEDRVETLCFELRYYLGGDGYLLLCACAVYPELVADLTFYLAHRFIAPDKREATLEALVCLPWFREAMMPDWLREELLADLTYEQEIEVREAIERLLINYLEHPQKGFNLEIATQKKEVKEGFWQRRRRRKPLHDVIKTEPENSPLKDYVFLKFISGSKLAISLPRQLSRFLQSHTVGQGLLIKKLFRDVVLRDRDLVRTLQEQKQRSPILGWILTALGALIVLVSLVLAGISLYNNKQLLDDASAKDEAVLTIIESDAGKNPLTKTPQETVRELNAVEDLRRVMVKLDDYERNGAPFYMGMGFYSGDKIYKEKLLPHYFSVIEKRFKDPTVARIESELRKFNSSVAFTNPAQLTAQEEENLGKNYDLLKAYLMLSDEYKDRANAADISNALKNYWTTESKIPAEMELSAQQQLKFWAKQVDREEDPGGFPRIALDWALVKQTRKKLQAFPTVFRYYKRKVAEISKEVDEKIGLTSVEGILTRNGADTSFVEGTYTVPSAYTLEGYKLMKTAIGEADTEFMMDDWVIGEQDKNITTQTTDASKLEELYMSDYADHWRSFVKGVNIKPYTKENAKEALESFSSANSPVKILARQIVLNTNFSAKPATSGWWDWLTSFWRSKQTTATGGNTPVEKVFLPLFSFVGEADKPAPIDAYQLEIGRVSNRFSGFSVTEINQLSQDLAKDDDRKFPELRNANTKVGNLLSGFNSTPAGQEMATLLRKPLENLSSLLGAEAQKSLETTWKTQLLAQAKEIERGFPFEDGQTETDLAKLTAYLNPESGTFSKFYKDNLQKYFDGNPGQLKLKDTSQVKFSDEFVAYLNKILPLRDALYGRGATPNFEYEFKMSPVTNAILEGTIDGQPVKSDASARLKFPASGGTETGVNIMLANIETISESSASSIKQPGTWGLFRFFNSGSPRKEATGEYTLTYTLGGKPVTATVKPSSGDLFDKELFKTTRAPEKFLKY